MKKDLIEACKLIVKYRGFFADLNSGIFVQPIYLDNGEHIDVEIGSAKTSKDLVFRFNTTTDKVVYYRPNEDWQNYILKLAGDIKKQTQNMKTPNQARNEEEKKKKAEQKAANGIPISFKLS